MAPRRLTVLVVAAAGFFVTAVTALACASAGAGGSLFGLHCAGCHGATLGGGIGPALSSPGFRAAWPNVVALFQYISQQMPAGAPGSLSTDQYRTLAGYLLEQNRMRREATRS